MGPSTFRFYRHVSTPPPPPSLAKARRNLQHRPAATPNNGQSDGATLELNPWAWNRDANIIYLESPAGVGFSYSDDPAGLSTNDAITANDTFAFLQGWFDLFPEYRGANDFYVTGESYGGHYVPTLAAKILDEQPDWLPAMKVCAGLASKAATSLLRAAPSAAAGAATPHPRPRRLSRGRAARFASCRRKGPRHREPRHRKRLVLQCQRVSACAPVPPAPLVLKALGGAVAGPGQAPLPASKPSLRRPKNVRPRRLPHALLCQLPLPRLL